MPPPDERSLVASTLRWSSSSATGGRGGRRGGNDEAPRRIPDGGPPDVEHRSARGKKVEGLIPRAMETTAAIATARGGDDSGSDDNDNNFAMAMVIILDQGGGGDGNYYDLPHVRWVAARPVRWTRHSEVVLVAETLADPYKGKTPLPRVPNYRKPFASRHIIQQKSPKYLEWQNQPIYGT